MRTVSNAAARPRQRARRIRRWLREWLAGLNQLLTLSDFSRGDIYRD